MASVIFSANFGDEAVLDVLRDSITNCCCVNAWKGLEEEVARLRENGLRIGSILRTPPGYSKQELSFAFQCWNTVSDDPPYNLGNDLKTVAGALFNRPLCVDLRAIGLD